MQDRHEQLEKLISGVLQRQPLLRAPSTLEARVLAQLARGAAAAWWQRSFAHWPLAAQGLFIVACAGFAKLALLGATWLFSAATTPATSVRNTAHIATSLSDVFLLLFNSIPTHWLYLGAAIGAGLYLALFGIGATAYRTLYK